MMTEPLWWRLSAGRRFAQGLADLRFEKGPRFLFVGETMIRHASPSRAITATSGGVHGATTWSCLIAPPSFLLIVAAGFLRAGSDAVDMTSITPATDKNLRAAASAQKHSARNFIDTCGSASRALRITALCIYYLSVLAGCEDPRIDGVRRNGDEISTAVGSMLFAGKEKRGGMGEPVLRSLEFHPCGGLRVVKRYTSGRSAEYCQN